MNNHLFAVMVGFAFVAGVCKFVSDYSKDMLDGQDE
jgi:hypothetical protein